MEPQPATAATSASAKLKEYAGRAIAPITSYGTSDGQSVLNPRRSFVVHTSSLAPHELCFGLNTGASQPGHKLPSRPRHEGRGQARAADRACDVLVAHQGRLAGSGRGAGECFGVWR